MDFKKKIKIRLYTYIAVLAFGIALCAVGYIKGSQPAANFGVPFIILGILQIFKHRHMSASKSAMQKREIEETDERNVMLWTKARSLSFTIYSLLTAIAIVVLYICGKDSAGQILSYSLCLLLLIYLICYFAMSRKY